VNSKTLVDNIYGKTVSYRPYLLITNLVTSYLRALKDKSMFIFYHVSKLYY